MTSISADFSKNDCSTELTETAADCIRAYQTILEDDYGTCLLGIEDEFVIQGIHYSDKQDLINLLTERLSEKYGEAFSSIDLEHPLMRVKESVEAGQNGALEIPDLFRLELVTNHTALSAENSALVNFGEQESDLVNKAHILANMRIDIWNAVEEFHENASVSWSPRPISDIYSYLTKSSNIDRDDVLTDIKRQATEKTDLIGRDAILAANSLEDLLLGDNAAINNQGAAGSGVHINIGFTGKDGNNPFYNEDSIDTGTPMTWNAAAGVIDITGESILPFINLRDASWQRIGNPHLSTAEEARYHPLKKGGAIIQQSPFSSDFYEQNNVPYKMTANEKNVHLEVRHCDGGAGIRDGAALISLQLATILAGMHHGIQNEKITSYEELMDYSHPIADNFDEAFEAFQTSSLYRRLLGDNLHSAVIDHVQEISRNLESHFIKKDMNDLTI